MAYNVFGNPVTNFTLEGMSQYQGKTITVRDRALVAFNLKNAQDKDMNARQYVEKLKEQFGSSISTLCLIYNANGGMITLVNNHDWFGHVGLAPILISIENGQWGAFLHVKSSRENSGSHAAVVYRGVNDAAETCDWMACWTNPWTRPVYTEIREANHYNIHEYWGYIHNLLDKRSIVSKRDHNVFNLFSTYTWNGCVSTMTTGDDTTAIVEAIFTLEDVET